MPRCNEESSVRLNVKTLVDTFKVSLTKKGEIIVALESNSCGPGYVICCKNQTDHDKLIIKRWV